MSTVAPTPEQLDARDQKALTEPMDVIPDDPARWNDAQVAVYNGGERYLVDPDTGTCDCPDAQHRSPAGGCKHVRRARYHLGIDAVPAWVQRGALDRPLREAAL